MIQTEDTKLLIEQLLSSEFHGLLADCARITPGSLTIRMCRSHVIEVCDGPDCKAEFLYTLLKHTHEEIGRLTVLAKHADFLLRHC